MDNNKKIRQKQITEYEKHALNNNVQKENIQPHNDSPLPVKKEKKKVENKFIFNKDAWDHLGGEELTTKKESTEKNTNEEQKDFKRDKIESFTPKLDIVQKRNELGSDKTVKKESFGELAKYVIDERDEINTKKNTYDPLPTYNKFRPARIKTDKMIELIKDAQKMGINIKQEENIDNILSKLIIGKQAPSIAIDSIMNIIPILNKYKKK